MDLRDKIKNITRYEYMNFMRYPNIVGVGRGNKYINDIDTGKLCIKVYVKEKYKKGGNEEGCIPKYYFGIPTDIIETGELKASIGFDKKIRPVKMGYGIAPLLRIDYSGTLGCIVKRYDLSENLEYFILSCNHVIADMNRLPIGADIVQPAGSDNKNVIAKLSDFERLKFITGKVIPENIIDAAIAKITDINTVRPQIAFMRIPIGIATSAFPNTFIKKSGQITGYTEGKILDDSVSVTIKYPPLGEVFFKDQLRARLQQALGDSGAMVLNRYDNVVGMLIGGGAQTTIINKI